MTHVAPPATTSDAPAPFRDPAACAAWVKALPLVNAAASHATLRAHLNGLNAANVAPLERLAMLELIRGAVITVQAEQAKKYVAKPLPLSSQRRESLNAVTALWDALGLGYRRALESLLAPGEDPQVVALAGHRALDSAARALLEHIHAYVQPRAQDFRVLHQVYSAVERLGVAGVRVSDPHVATERSPTCARRYAHALLLDAAAPRERHPDEIALIDRWLEEWAPRVPVLAEAPSGAVTPLVVDLDGENGAVRGAAPARPTVRYLDAGELAKTVAKRIQGLRRGRTAAEVKLDTDLPRERLEALLLGLYRQWCEWEGRRAHERNHVDAEAIVCAGLAAAHFSASEAALTDPSLTQGIDLLSLQGVNVERWVLRDESLGGLGLLRRRDGAAAGRLAHGQLILVRPDGATAGILATIQWLQETAGGDIRVGARVLPGRPRAVRVTAEDALADFPAPVPALSLSGLTALKAPPTLVLPTGWYRVGRKLDVHAEQAARVRLTGLLDAGGDFERVTYKTVS